MNIIKNETFSKNQSQVIIIDKTSNVENIELSVDEKAFAKKAIENKETQVFINRYTHWIVIQTIDSTKKPTRQLEDLRNGGFAICKFLQKQKLSEIAITSAIANKNMVLALAEGIALSNYQFLKYFTKASEKTTSLQTIAIVSDLVSNSDVMSLSAVVEGVCIARDLVNEPASTLTSLVLSHEIEKIGNEAGFTVRVFHKSEIEEMKMGGLLAVNQGSTQPPTFSVLEWKPANAVNQKPIVLVGKGLVYDTGGYSLKPTPNSMDYMKCDMAGSAAVIGALHVAAKTKLPIHVIGLVPSTDNRLSADAYSPGDVITMMDGTTVEVMNTDAEGRLILADALCYAKQYNPELVFTIATLTGAAHRAIGTQGLVGMGNTSDEITAKIMQSGESVYERVALFPFWEEYADALKSDIADLKNIGGELAGAITAGKFLEHFTNYPFFHLDIAGPAFLNKGESYKGTGGTGYGVRLFVEFLKNLAVKR